MSLFIHPSNQPLITALKADLPQSTLLTGDKGIGLLTIAKEIAGSQLALIIQPQDAKDEVDEASGTISIEMIRRLYEQTRAKHTTPRIIIIDDADKMSAGGQAAFLKLLEEPNRHIYFILTSHTPEGLLATIRSRLQRTHLRPATLDQTKAQLTELQVTEPTKIAQLLFIAEGLPAEINRLIKNEEYFQKRAKIMADARLLLQGDPYEKLLLAQRYQTSRSDALQLIDASLLIARRTLSQKPQATLIKQVEKLLDIQTNIAANHNTRLQLGRCSL